MNQHEIVKYNLELLPEDLLQYICSFVPLRDLFRIELVNKKLNRLCWRAVRNIDFTRFRFILSEDIVNYVLTRMLTRNGKLTPNPTVHKVIIPHTWHNSIQCLDKLQYFVNLEFLDTGSLRGSETLQSVAKCVSLRSLELNDDLINVNYATTLTTLNKLTRLHIPSFDRMSDVLSHLTNLKHLALSLCFEEVPFISYIKLTALTNLTHLKMDLTFVTVKDLFSVLFTALTNLNVLEINFAHIVGSEVTILSKLSNLRYLSFENCMAVDVSRIPFNSLPNLYQLHLPKTETRDDKPSFTACTALEVLNMNSALGLAENLVLNPTLLKHVIELSLSSNELGFVGSYFNSMCYLQRLTLNFNGSVDLHFLSSVTTLIDLKMNSSLPELNLSLVSLTSLTNLKALSLTRIKLDSLNGMWSTFGHRLLSLSLIECEESITDIFVEQLTSLCCLTSLVLKPCSHITDHSLFCLLLLTQLRHFEAKHISKLTWKLTPEVTQVLCCGWKTSLRSLCLTHTPTDTSLLSLVAELQNLQSFKSGPLSTETGQVLPCSCLEPFLQSKALTEFVVWPLSRFSCGDTLTKLWHHCNKNYLWTDDSS